MGRSAGSDRGRRLGGRGHDPHDLDEAIADIDVKEEYVAQFWPAG
jgi:hypothetical protein